MEKDETLKYCSYYNQYKSNKNIIWFVKKDRLGRRKHICQACNSKRKLALRIR